MMDPSGTGGADGIMATTGQKWLIGCAVGCLVVLLLVAMLITGTCVYFRGVVGGARKIEKSQKELVERFGEPDEFRPPADGSIPGDRIVTFLEVRRSLAADRGELHGVFERFPRPEEEQEQGKLRTFFRVVGGLVGMIDDVMGYIDARNRALLDHGMGYGEYLYIYSVAYYSWLAHDPTDGPTTADGERLFDGSDSTFGVDACRRSYRSFMLAVLRNQLRELPEDADPGWRERLRDEIGTMERDRRYIAWRDGLPQLLEASLAPHREELAATYDPVTNCLELPTERDRGGFHWEMD